MECTYKENHITVIALHKHGKVTKTVKYYVCFVYYTVKLLLNMGGVSDCKRSGHPRMVRTPQISNAVRSRIN